MAKMPHFRVFDSKVTFVSDLVIYGQNGADRKIRNVILLIGNAFSLTSHTV